MTSKPPSYLQKHPPQGKSCNAATDIPALTAELLQSQPVLTASQLLEQCDLQQAASALLRLRSLDPLLSQHLQLLLDADRHIEGMVAIRDLVMALPTELLLDYMQRGPAGGHRAAGRTRCHCAQRCRR